MKESLNKRELLALMKIARANVNAEMRRKSSDDMFSRGLANEGYAGGYLQALDDIEALLRHGYPTDPRNYWILHDERN